jgi:hypothetical protein
LVEVLAGALGSNHQPLLPGLLVLALAFAVWQRSFVALVIATILLAFNALIGAVAYGWLGFLFVAPFLAATVQALPVVRRISKTPTPSTSPQQDPPVS